ncbi:hypothetical protein JCM4814A_94200 [Streptomyces phaeofaciens JCM 4814]|uniref:Uncharacterized protein n=1 Tax=Streptomyces phaeofaciens TaxID=68254 RepID=A0A918M256_9ACTN|nr:hypothetical protein [Streptomyces phaeofaciens]GGT99585.1 hypothetical protein GCM10010226_90830 [Streptomyces phaeofaciens]
MSETLRSETFWTAVGALGTMLALFVVAWQSVLTRASLRITRQMAADSIRSRLDSQAPEVTLALDDPIWEPQAWNSTGMPCGSWPPGQTWHFPEQQDGSNRLVLQQIAVVQNLSQRRVQVRCEGDLVVADNDNRPVRAGVFLVDPGGRSPELYLQRDFTIKQLADNHAARESGRELPHRAVASVTVEDDRDNGTTDRWDLLLTGCPVEPVAGRDALWTIAPYHLTEGPGLRTLTYSRLPSRQRIHWISRIADARVPLDGA